MANKIPSAEERFEVRERHDLRLYVIGNMQSSTRAIANIKAVCDDRLPGRYDLTVIDLRQQSNGDNDDGILVAPALVRRWPLPVLRLVGDLTNPETLLRGLHLPEGPA